MVKFLLDIGIIAAQLNEVYGEEYLQEIRQQIREKTSKWKIILLGSPVGSYDYDVKIMDKGEELQRAFLSDLAIFFCKNFFYLPFHRYQKQNVLIMMRCLKMHFSKEGTEIFFLL